jgi:hypothetical protein
MENAGERLCHHRFDCRSIRVNLNQIHGWNCDELGEAARKSRDTKLAVPFALMREATGAVLAEVLLAFADTTEALIDDDSIPGCQICHTISDIDDGAGNFMTQNLWVNLDRKSVV